MRPGSGQTATVNSSACCRSTASRPTVAESPRYRKPSVHPQRAHRSPSTALPAWAQTPSAGHTAHPRPAFNTRTDPAFSPLKMRPECNPGASESSQDQALARSKRNQSAIRVQPERNQSAINIKLNVRSTPTQVAPIHLLPTQRLTTVNLCVTTRPKIHIPATTLHILTSAPSHPHSEGDVGTLRSKPTPKDTPPRTPSQGLLFTLR